jgi:hypothetical protein
MKVTIGKAGLAKTQQDEFPETTQCCKCKGEARIGFVAHEGIDMDDRKTDQVCRLHFNEGKGGMWPHDYVSVAVYFCRECLEVTALYNQG